MNTFCKRNKASTTRPAVSRRCRVAFTLVELLVVVSIIALLIAILLPSLKKARVQAKTVKCGSHLHDIGIGLTSYAVEFGRFPVQNTLGTAPLHSEPRDRRTAVGFLTLSAMEEINRHMGGLQQNRQGLVNADGSLVRTRTHEVFYCPFAPAEVIDFADALHGDYPDGTQVPGSETGSHVAEDAYLHIGYSYLGGLHEARNNPANKMLTGGVAAMLTEDVKQLILAKRRSYVRSEPDGARVLMADMVSMFMPNRTWRINHGAGWGINAKFDVANFRPPKLDGANLLYGDAHVERKGRDHFKEITSLETGGQEFYKLIQSVTLPFEDRGTGLWW